MHGRDEKGEGVFPRCLRVFFVVFEFFLFFSF